MTCPRSQNMPLAEPRCRRSLALESKACLCSTAAQDKSRGDLEGVTPFSFGVCIQVSVSGLGAGGHLSIQVAIHNFTFIKCYLCASPDQGA